MVCSSAEPGPEAAAAEAVRQRIDLPAGSVLGPAPLFRLKGRDRAQLVVKSPEREAAIVAVRRAVEEVSADREHRGASYSVDVDPQ